MAKNESPKEIDCSSLPELLKASGILKMIARHSRPVRLPDGSHVSVVPQIFIDEAKEFFAMDQDYSKENQPHDGI